MIHARLQLGDLLGREAPVAALDAKVLLHGPADVAVGAVGISFWGMLMPSHLLPAYRPPRPQPPRRP